MSQVFCRACGKQVDSTAQFCSNCGANQGQATIANANASQPMHVQATAKPAFDAIKYRELMWERRFALIDKAGGVKLPQVWSLPPKEIFLIRWNLAALFFGPIYYAAKGMWKKGLTLWGIGVLIAFVGAVLLEEMGFEPDAMIYLPSVVFCLFANVNFYRRTKEGFTGWW